MKGSNLHPTPGQFSVPSAEVWVNVWGGAYDLAYIKESIDKTKTTGVNVFRTIGSTLVVTGGTITRAQYLTRQTDVAAYCQSVGVRYYPTGEDLVHRGGSTDAAMIAEIVALYQAMIPYGSTIFGFDMYNEYRNDPAGLTHAAQIVKDTATAIRGAGRTPIPLAASINADIFNPDLIRAIAPYINYLDFHIYLTLAYLQANPTMFAFLQQVAPGFKIVVGEIGISRNATAGNTAQQRADFYTAMLTIQQNTPQMLGTCNWAAINDDYGLFDYTTRTLQTDISGSWAQFPNT